MPPEFFPGPLLGPSAETFLPSAYSRSSGYDSPAPLKDRPEHISSGVSDLTEGMSPEARVTDARTGFSAARHEDFDIPGSEDIFSAKAISKITTDGDQTLPDRTESYTTTCYPPSRSDETVYSSINYTKTGRVSKAKKGAKPYDCECGRSYSRPEHFRRHQKNHTYEDGMVCTFPECGKYFFRPDLLARHQERQ